MKTFQQTFQSCAVTTEVQTIDKRMRPREGASNSGNASNNNSGKTTQVKSWFQGFGETVQQLVTGNNAGQDVSGMKKSSSSNSFDGDIDLPDGHAKGNFKPKENRKKLTAEQVDARMKAYNAGESSLKTSSSSSTSTANSTKVVKGSSPEVTFHLSKAVVLYYCASLIANVPGTMYITQQHVCLVSSVLGYYQKTEIFALANLTDIALFSTGLAASNSDQNDGNAASVTLLATNALKLTFFNGLRSITVSPMVVDCARVKTIIELVKLQFLTSKSVAVVVK